MDKLQFKGEDEDEEELEIPENWDDETPTTSSVPRTAPAPNIINNKTYKSKKKKKNKKFKKNKKDISNMSSKEIIEKNMKERLQQENSEIELIREFIGT